MYERCGYACEGDRGALPSYSKRIVWLTPERPEYSFCFGPGRCTYLVQRFLEALGGRGLVHASNSDPAATSRCSRPRGGDPADLLEAYVPFMLDYCERERIGAIVPLFDAGHSCFAAHRAEFEAIGASPSSRR